jgi:large subunit ribosomal protein L24
MAHVKKGDEIVVIAGSELGKRGKVLEIITKKNRVLVEGVKIMKRHTRKNQNNPQGAIVEREAAIHLSNVVLASKYDAKHGKAEAAKA